MDEKSLKADLVRELRSRVPWVVLRLETGQTTSGVPDIVVVGNHYTSWWEVKYADPDFTSKGIQELTCLRLAKHGFCRYIIYSKVDDNKEIYIVPPSEFAKWQQSVNRRAGFDHNWVCDYIIRAHQHQFESDK